MKFVQRAMPQEEKHISRFPFLLEIGTIEDDNGAPICRLCEIVEPHEPGTSSSFVCLPTHDILPVLDASCRTLLLSGAECALFDANRYGSALRNIVNHVATRFNYVTQTVQEHGEQQRNATLYYHRDVVSLVAALSDAAINRDIALHNKDATSP